MSVTQNEALKALQQESFLKQLGWFDWAWALVIVSAMIYTFMGYSSAMDVYDKGILISTGFSLIALGWFWKSMRWLSLVVAVLSMLAIMIYATKISSLPSQFSGRTAVDVLSSSAAEHKPYATFFLKYFLVPWGIFFIFKFLSFLPAGKLQFFRKC